MLQTMLFLSMWRERKKKMSDVTFLSTFLPLLAAVTLLAIFAPRIASRR